LKEWIPWWYFEEQAHAFDITEIDDKTPEDEFELDTKLEVYRKVLRERYAKLPEITKLTKVAPNPVLQFHLLNFLFGACYLLRRYNGDIKTNCESISFELFQICNCLENKEIIPNTQIALDKAIEETIKSDKGIANKFKAIILDDINKVLSRKFFVFEILFRMYDIYHQAHDNITKASERSLSEKDTQLRIEEMKRLIAVKHKLLFYLAYFKSQNQQLFELLNKEVLNYIAERKTREEFNENMEKAVKVAKTNEILLK